MDEQQLQAYLSLIQELLTCASGEEAARLRNHPELVDEGLVQVMRAEAEKRAQQGRGNAGWLRNFAGTIAAVDYELPRLQIELRFRLSGSSTQAAKPPQGVPWLQRWHEAKIEL
ncbi:MAG: hypothetical protein HLUCCO16_14680 [Phormidium sp. OSCR]|nr:MAG: hypothetical protein HLUCCO16_14680 [Phormidium sp. OSCR]